MKKNPVRADIVSAVSERVPRRMLLALVGGVAVLAAILVAYSLLSGDGDSAPGRAMPTEYERLAERLAGEIAAVLDPYRGALDALSGDAEVRAALSNGDTAAMKALGTTRRPQLEGVLKLRVLPADTEDPDTSENPPLSFACLSMIRAAREDGVDPPGEVHLGGSDKEHLVLLRRVTVGTAAAEQPELLGFVHLSISPGVVRNALSATVAPEAFIEVRQGPMVTIATRGVKSGADAPRTVANIDGTRLAVVFSAPGVAPESAASPASLQAVMLFAVLALVAAGAAFFVLRRGGGVASAARSGESVIYQGAIKAILEGAHPGLEKLLPGGGGQTGQLDGFGGRAEGDDVTVITRPADASVPPAPLDHEVPAEIDVIEEGVADEVPASIFREYDIRGIVGETLTEDGVYQIGRALGAEADARGQGTLVVARDGRHSSEALAEALTRGLLESGREVVDIGLTPTPVLYFATHYLDAHSGVMITGSHNPAQYNGLKIVLDGETLSGEAIQAVRRRVVERDFVDGKGTVQTTEIVPDYIRRISEEIPVTLGNALKIVVDCGNGVPGIVAPAILRAIGHDVIELYCEVDGDFPNHHPDPSQPDNLRDLIDMVAEEDADLGLAFDGDGDRLGVVDSEGNIIWPDRQMILFARDILSRNPGAKIIYDVKCSRILGAEIAAHGGEPIMARTGHSLIKSEMQKTGALLAGEMSGHIFFKERWYGFDDALYSAARLCEILVNAKAAPAEVFASLPGGVATPELRIDMPEERHAEFMKQVLAAASFDDAEVTTIDGLRVDFSDSWGLVRPSNTTPCLVLRFEGDDEAALEKVKQRFRDLIGGVDATLTLPF